MKETGRSRKEMKIDRNNHYDDMEKTTPDPKATERFRRKPYQTAREK